jgi:hypothetical protein
MQRLKGRNIVFGALAVLACSGDPTGNESTPTAIQSNPDVVFVTQGDSEPVVVTVLDEDGNVLQADVTQSNVGSGITVRLDPTYQEVTTGNPIQRGTRFFVKGVDLAHTSFKVTALGLTKTIEVTSVPGSLDAEITDSQPTLGDTVTITAPSGTFFTENSVLTFNGAAPVVTAQDETTISFIPMANIFGPALVDGVGVTTNPDLLFSLTTPFNVQTDSIVDIGTGLSNTAPALGVPVTLTLPAGLKLIPESLATVSVAGAGLFPIHRTLSADSTVITFTPPPNADSFVVVNGVIPASLAACCASAPNYALLLGTTNKVTTPVVDTFPSTVSDLTPDIGQELTVTSTDPAYTISDTASVIAGGVPATVTARTANSITFIPSPGAVGGITVNGVVIAEFSLALPSSGGDISVPPPLEGTGDPTTAPAIELNTTVFDAGTFDYQAPIFGGQFGTFPARLYKVVVPADGDVTVTIDWPSDQDLGGYWFAEDGVTEPGFDPADNGGAGAHPETVTNTMTAGTYILAVVNFGEGDPPVFTINVSE